MPEPDTGSEQRLERRNNLFVVAALRWLDAASGASGAPGAPAAPVPVRIRNLSPTGALIEGALLPQVGTSVHLSRGQHSVAGELKWRGETQAGLQFSTNVEVADWLPASARSTGQQRVDRIVFEAKAAGVGTGITPAGPSAPDYAAIARALVAAGDELLAVPGLAERHPGALQVIDIAAQALGLLTRRQ